MDTEAIGQRLRQARADRGWSQNQLAATAHIGIKTLYNLEHGAWQTGTVPPSLIAVCDALGLEPDQLLRDPIPMESPSDPDAERLLLALSRMPKDVRAAMFVVGGWLSRLPEGQRQAEIDRILMLALES